MELFESSRKDVDLAYDLFLPGIDRSSRGLRVLVKVTTEKHSISNRSIISDKQILGYSSLNDCIYVYFTYAKIF